MSLGAMKGRAMKQLTNVLLHHENEKEKNERVLFRQGQLFHVDFIMKWKKSFIMGLLNSCISKVTGGYNNNN